MSVQRLLEQAHPRPETLPHAASDVLPLALHCLMVNAGFTVLEEPAASRPSKFSPPKMWNKVPQEWIFEYTKPGKANKFTLHASLPPQSYRMFVHASEPDNHANIQILGLQLNNYVPEPEKLQQGSWEGVVENEDKLVELFTQHILEPLTATAEDAAFDSNLPELTSQSTSLSTYATYGVPVLAAAVVLAAAIIVYRYRQRS